MANEPKNHGKPWSNSDVQQLKQLAKANMPTRVLSLKLGRTPDAVQQKASAEQVSLKPTNQNPYGTKK